MLCKLLRITSAKRLWSVLNHFAAAKQQDQFRAASDGQLMVPLSTFGFREALLDRHCWEPPQRVDRKHEVLQSGRQEREERCGGTADGHVANNPRPARPLPAAAPVYWLVIDI